MRKGTALQAVLLLGAAATGGAWLLLRPWSAPPAPFPVVAAPPPAGPAAAPPAPPPAEGPPIPPPSLPAAPVPSQPFLPSGLPAWDFDLPAGESGPVVVGRVTRTGDPDPDCWISLESLEEPGREDPSVLESFNEGGFRLTRFRPGRYRVRARMDGAAAVYSREFDAREGTVVDAGLLVLRDDGAIAGILLDAGGRAVDGVVSLFGRDPATLRPRVVGTARALGRQGFQLPPHESGPFTLGVRAAEGWARVEGAADERGLAWVEVRLRPYGRVEMGGLPGVEEPAPLRLLPLEVPDLGSRQAPLEARPGATLEGVLPGRWSVRIPREGGEEAREVLVPEGAAVRVEPR